MPKKHTPDEHKAYLIKQIKKVCRYDNKKLAAMNAIQTYINKHHKKISAKTREKFDSVIMNGESSGFFEAYAG